MKTKITYIPEVCDKVRYSGKIIGTITYISTGLSQLSWCRLEFDGLKDYNEVNLEDLKWIKETEIWHYSPD